MNGTICNVSTLANEISPQAATRGVLWKKVFL